MFNTSKKKLNTLIKTDRYKNSKYQIEKVNGAWGLKHKPSGDYVDLCNGVHKWTYGSTYTKDCFSGLGDVLRIFNFCVPIIEPITEQEVY